MPTLKTALTDFVGIFASGLSVLGAHWPQLVGLFLAGWAGRMASLWVAVLVSDVSPTVAVLLLPLAPLCTLASLVLMLRVTAESLPAFRDLFDGVARAQRWRGHILVAAQVLLPFLAVYASQGMLVADSHLFLHDATADEWMTAAPGSIDFGRAEYASGPYLIAMILIAIVGRKAISLLELGKKAIAWAFLAAYLEVLWLVTLGRSLTTQVDEVLAWVTSRRLVDQVLSWWATVVDSIPRLWGVNPIDAIGGLLASAGDLVVVPVAWLAIGAAVYGAKLAGAPIETPEEVTARLNRIPSPVRRVVAHAVEPVVTPISDAAAAVRKIAGAGVLPMVLFCVVFVVAAQVKVGVAWLFRAIVGPRDPWVLYSLAPYSDLLQRLCYFVLALALLSAAVNAVVLGQRTDAAHADTADAQLGTSSTA